MNNHELVYRFRPHDNLLDGYAEITNQSIYFASLAQLNDPAEGLVNYLWIGDKVIWENFFKNYIQSLAISWYQLTSPKRDSENFEDSVVTNITLSAIEKKDEDLRNFLFSVSDEFLNTVLINGLVRYLSNLDVSIGSAELRIYLKIVHERALLAVFNQGELAKLTPPNEGVSYAQIASEQITNTLDTEYWKIFSDEIKEYLNASEGVTRSEAFFQKLSPDFLGIEHTLGEQNWTEEKRFLKTEFPNVYIGKLDKIIFPNWYVASFSKDYSNSSMWGQYADSHKGICMEFKLGKNRCLPLTGLHEDIPNEFLMNDVDYSGYREVNFFENVAIVCNEEKFEYWFTKEGEKSTRYESLKSMREKNNMNEEWLKKVFSKSKDWEHEEECRLILPEVWNRLSDSKSRTANYDLLTLSGVVFGINTPQLTISKIINHFRNLQQPSSFFKMCFYQAYYSHESHSIKRYKFNLSGF